MGPAQHLGDEPLYCEALHDHDLDDVYSGSDDDYYETSLDRRLNIERKALQFLSGGAPVLCSARLHGPFDREHWNNPWKSQRTKRQKIQHIVQASYSQQLVEAARGSHCLVQSQGEDLPGTQGTSLYPLPSPEITDPPSAKKNMYMSEDEYHVVKRWRETVQGASVSRDVFCSLQHRGEDIKPISRKRTADDEWLRRRHASKRRPANSSVSRLGNPPSRSPAKKRIRQYSQVSKPSIHYLRKVSEHHDELATDEHSPSPNVNPFRTTERSIETPVSSRTQRVLPRRKERKRHDADTSDDELSLPCTTPTYRSAKCVLGSSMALTGRRLPRQVGPGKSKSRTLLVGEQALEAQVGVEPSKGLLGRRVDLVATRRLSQKAVCMSAEAAEDMVGGDGLHPAGQAKPAVTEKSVVDIVAVEAKAHVQLLAGMLLSQQDDSFCFHKRPRSLEVASNRFCLGLPLHAKEGNALSLASLQSRMAPAPGQTCILEGAGSGNDQDDHKPHVSAEPADRIETDPGERQDLPHNLANKAEEGLVALADVNVPVHPVDGASSVGVTQWQDGDKTSPQPVASNRAQVPVEPQAAHETHGGDESEHADQAEDAPPANAVDTSPVSVLEDSTMSDSAWSTYLNTQDLPPSSINTEEGPKAANPTSVIDDGVCTSDSEWFSYVNTESLSTMTTQTIKEPREDDGATGVVYKGCNDVSDSEWSTFFSTHDLSEVSEPQKRDLSSTNQEATEVETVLSAHGPMEVERHDGQSNSGWSTCWCESSQAHTDRTGNVRHDAVSTRSSPCVRRSHSSVALTVDVHTQSSGHALVQIDPVDVSLAPADARQDMAISTTEPCITDLLLEGQPAGSQSGALTSWPSCPSDEDGAEAGTTKTSLGQSGQSFAQAAVAPENEVDPSADCSNLDVSSENSLLRGQSSTVLPTPLVPDNRAYDSADFSYMKETTVSIEEEVRMQSPWTREVGPELYMPRAYEDDSKQRIASGLMDETVLSTDLSAMQSPWAKEGGIASQAQAAPEDDMASVGDVPNLNLFVGKALVTSPTRQSPWIAQSWKPSRFATPDFTVPIRAFSEFSVPSPTKKRALPDGSILRNSSSPAHVAFRTCAAHRPKARVHFAPLPGNEGSGSSKVSADEGDSVYIEEDVSYFDDRGRKTGTVRLPHQRTKVVSPPPLNVGSFEVEELVGHEKKFAKHFAAMAKRKKEAHRKPLRLLPSDSQRTTASTGSQEVGAMAEAFIQASQTRRQGLRSLHVECEDQTAGRAVVDESSFIPTAATRCRGQGSREPVDDVSAVLENLGDFLDKTWGVDISIGDEGSRETKTETSQKENQQRQGTRRVPKQAGGGDPVLSSLEVNVWAD